MELVLVHKGVPEISFIIFILKECLPISHLWISSGLMSRETARSFAERPLSANFFAVLLAMSRFSCVNSSIAGLPLSSNQMDTKSFFSIYVCCNCLRYSGHSAPFVHLAAKLVNRDEFYSLYKLNNLVVNSVRKGFNNITHT